MERIPHLDLGTASALFALCMSAACGSSHGTAENQATIPKGERPQFSYATIDGSTISQEGFRGRTTVIGFVTTYDLASQAQARFLSALLRNHTPRLNVAIVVLESIESRPLIEAFATSLKLPYPVLIADEATIAGRSAFVGLHHVPAVSILDKNGVEVFRRVGLTDEDALEKAVNDIESGH